MRIEQRLFPGHRDIDRPGSPAVKRRIEKPSHVLPVERSSKMDTVLDPVQEISTGSILAGLARFLTMGVDYL